MSQPRTVTVDVRDMLCAQALALVAQAVERLPASSVLEVLTSAQDVRRDLAVWARERGHGLTQRNDAVLVITPGRA